jgi:FkbM family methyltransferase
MALANPSSAAIVAAVATTVFGIVDILPYGPAWAAVIIAADRIGAERSPRSWLVAGGFLSLAGIICNTGLVASVLMMHPALPLVLGTLLAIVLLIQCGFRLGVLPAGLAVLASLLLTLAIPSGALLQVRVALVQAKISGALPGVSWSTVADQLQGSRHFTADYFGMRYHGDAANLIDAHVLLYGAWEPQVLHFLRSCADALNSDSVVFVDVGANTGLHSLFMSRYASHVHAFDPYPPVVARFRTAVDENHLSNITIHQVGLGNADELVPFHKPPGHNQGTGSFLWGIERGNSTTGTSLQIVRGDEYFEKKGIDVDIIKMDIEGFEKPALLGLRSILERDRPVVEMEITAESGREGLFESFEDLQAAFPANYSFHTLRGGRLLDQDARSGPDGRIFYSYYELADLDLNFQGPFNQRDVAAIPFELLPLIPPASREE